MRMAFRRLRYRLMSLVEVFAAVGLVWVVADGLLGIELRPWMLIFAVLVGIAYAEGRLRSRKPRQVRLLGLIPLAPRHWFCDLTPNAGNRSTDHNLER